MALGDPVAISIGVIHKGKILEWHAGTVSLEKSSPPNANTIYEIGSITKVFTALQLASEVSQGHLSLKTPVKSLLPEPFEIPSFQGKPIQLVHLATHTSHLPRIPKDLFNGADLQNPYAHYGSQNLQKSLANQNITAAPGGKPVSYSNFGYGLLGYALAAKNNTDYPTLLKQQLFKPLGMKSTNAGPNQLPHEARGYNLGHDPQPRWKFDALAGAGAMRSNLTDMLTFAKFCMKPGHPTLTPVLELSLKPQVVTGRRAQCLGWQRAADQTTYWHNGMTYGFASYLGFNREHDIAVCILSSGASPHITALGEHIIRNFATSKHTAYRINRPQSKVSLSGKHLTTLTGTYQLAPKSMFTVKTRNNRMFVKLTGQPFLEVFPESATKFKYHAVKAHLEFSPGKSLTLYQNGRVLVAKKISKE